MARLSAEEIDSALKNIPSWKHDGKTTLNGIRKVYKFKDFKEAWAFMTKVAALADAADHHPEWSNEYNRVDIMLTTHSSGGVTAKDTDLAAKIEEAYKSLAN